jgi:hypothetical protein
LFEAHKHHRRLCEDQEQVKNGGAHITRICAALSSLSQSLFIAIIDKPNTFPGSTFDLSDRGLMQTCLAASDWKASFTTSFSRPPMEMIPEIFTAMAATTVRPTRFEIDFKPPWNLGNTGRSILALTPAGNQAIKVVLSQTK